MGYIGNTPAEKYQTLQKQSFTTSATTSYTLSYSVTNPQEIALFINNVRQNPNSSYTVSGTTLTLSSATTGTDVMYAVFLGKSVGTIAPALGSVTNDMLSGSIATSKLANQNIGFRNLIINGDMSQAQRGTSVNNTNGAPYLIDRFRNQAVYSSTAPTATIAISQSTTVPSGQGFVKSTKYDVTTAQGSLTTDTGYALEQRIEGQMLQNLKKGTSNAEPLTLSFWVRSNKTGTYVVELADTDNSRQCSQAYTISSANTWEKKTLNYPADTTGAFTNDNATSLKIRIWVAAGATFTSGTLATTWASTSNGNSAVGQVNLVDSTSNEWYITGLQLEIGTTASDFENIPYDINLQRCERYFTVINNNGRNGDAFYSGFTSSATVISGVMVPLPNSLREGNPTITLSGSVPMQRCTVDGFQTLGTGVGSVSNTAEGNNSHTLCLICSNYSGMTANRPAVVSFPAVSNAITVDAEL